MIRIAAPAGAFHARELETPGLLYYRPGLRHGRAVLARHRAPIATPLLALHGADDGCILPPTDEDRARFAGPYVRQTLPGVGHFPHVEDPAGVAAHVLRWLSAPEPPEIGTFPSGQRGNGHPGR